MSGFGFCFYCRKIWFPWLIEYGSLRRSTSWECLFEKAVIPFHCALPIGSETEKAEWKPHHARLLLSLQSSRCRRGMAVLGLWAAAICSSHWSDSITRQLLGRPAKLPRELSGSVPTDACMGWEAAFSRGGSVIMCAGVQPSDALSCSRSEPHTKLALCVLSSWWGAGVSQETFMLI